MVMMNGGFIQTPLKNTGQKLIMKLGTWCIILIFGMNNIKLGIQLWLGIFQTLRNISGNDLYLLG